MGQAWWTQKLLFSPLSPLADGQLCEAARAVALTHGGDHLLGRIDSSQLTFVHPQVRSVRAWVCLCTTSGLGTHKNSHRS